MGRIFVCGDSGQEALLGEAASALCASGHEIVRGPANVPGLRKVYSSEERDALIGGADVAVFTNRHRIDRSLLGGLHRLKGVVYPVTGVESLDLDAANELGLIVGHGHVRGNAVGMAEATIMLMLMLFYNVQNSIAAMADGGWARPGSPIHSLDGKTIGLVGFGNIAREVVERLASFKVRIITSSPRARQQSLPPGVTKVELDTLLAQSDLISILTGLTPETRGMIGSRELALVKPGCRIVNTGRGEVIDEEALVAALRSGHIGAAALDAFAAEPLPADSPLRSLDNVILTPHCVGHTVESLAEFGPALVENVSRILDGRLPLYCKNPAAEPAWRKRLAAISRNAGQ